MGWEEKEPVCLKCKHHKAISPWDTEDMSKEKWVRMENIALQHSTYNLSVDCSYNQFDSTCHTLKMRRQVHHISVLVAIFVVVGMLI